MNPLRSALPLRLALPLALALLAGACSNETIILASIPVNDAGTPAAPQKCVDSSTCPTGYYCDLPECGALTGICELPPPVCDSDEDPHCGCDHVTYFNDCLRRVSGVSSSTPGPCQEAGILCGGPIGATCPEGALCAQLGGFIHGACDHPIPGTCWVVPGSCGPTTHFDYYDACNGSGDCLSTCAAIRAGGAYRRSQQQCP